MTLTDVITHKEELIKELLKDDGKFPNNERLPTLIYKNALHLSSGDAALRVERLFNANGWGNSWHNGVFDYHHYHSIAHEVLGIYGGIARIQLGGPSGITFDAMKGDVIIIPAGVAHKNLGSSKDFACVGAYPAGQDYDMNYGYEGERPGADENIARAPLPETDPVFGSRGYVIQYWVKNS